MDLGVMVVKCGAERRIDKMKKARRKVGTVSWWCKSKAREVSGAPNACSNVHER